MTMTLDHNQHRFGPVNLDMSSFSAHPHFTDPWVSSSSPAGPGQQSGSQQHSLYVGNQNSSGLPHLNLGALPRHPGPLPRHPSHSQHSPHGQHVQQPQQPQQPAQHGSTATSSASMAPYGSLPVTAASAGSPPVAGVYRPPGLLPMSQDLLSVNRLQHPTTPTTTTSSSSAAYDTSTYTSAASPVNATYATSPTPYEPLGYAQAQAQMRGTFALGPQDSSRRYSQQSVASSLMDPARPPDHGAGTALPRIELSNYDHRGVQPDDRRSFQEALEASHGMLSMSQETPRNIYDVRARGRGSADSYGFPSTHSATSSVSSTGFSGYYGGSIDGSVSDYSTTGSDIESLSGRALPRPQGLMSSHPPAPQSMMGSFSSKVSSSTQKKHKCKVCDKRFTRPSSLQTHMYSHTGEKRESSGSRPAACEAARGANPVFCCSVRLRCGGLWSAVLRRLEPPPAQKSPQEQPATTDRDAVRSWVGRRRPTFGISWPAPRCRERLATQFATPFLFTLLPSFIRHPG